jgi:hypothetical protein
MFLKEAIGCPWGFSSQSGKQDVTMGIGVHGGNLLFHQKSQLFVSAPGPSTTSGVVNAGQGSRSCCVDLSGNSSLSWW